VSTRVEHELCQTLYGVRRAVCESVLQKTRRELVGAQQIGRQCTWLCLYAVGLLLNGLRRSLLVELGDWRFGGGEVERCIVLLGAALATKRRMLVLYVGQADVHVRLVGLAGGLRWSGSYDFRVDG